MIHVLYRAGKEVHQDLEVHLNPGEFLQILLRSKLSSTNTSIKKIIKIKNSCTGGGAAVEALGIRSLPIQQGKRVFLINHHNLSSQFKGMNNLLELKNRNLLLRISPCACSSYVMAFGHA